MDHCLAPNPSLTCNFEEIRPVPMLKRQQEYLGQALVCERRMESYPKFQNEVGAPIVRIGCHEFECIGDKPPQDHPHVYLNMGDASDIAIVCPYCSTICRPISSARASIAETPCSPERGWRHE